MRRLLIPLAFLCASALCSAQVTYSTITGTVVDANSNPYANAVIMARLVTGQGFPASSPATPNGQLFNGSPVIGTLDSTGHFSINLVPNASLSKPSGTKWRIQITAPSDPNILVNSAAWNITYDMTVAGNQDISSQLSSLSTQPISFLNLKTNQSTFSAAGGLPVNNPTFSGALTGPSSAVSRYLDWADPTAACLTYRGQINVKDCGAKGDGTTNDVAAFVAAVSTGANVYVPAGTYNFGTFSLTIPSTVRQFDMVPSASILYSGSGTAVTISGIGQITAPMQMDYRINVKRASTDWPSGSDTTSVGVSAVNINHYDLHVSASGFHDGFELVGNGNGSTENNIYPGNFQDNMISYQHRIVGSGWTNQNKIFGGEFRINTANCPGGLPIAGTKYILLNSGSDNMNVFFSPDLEGACVERTFDVYSGVNFLYAPRLEGNVANSLYFEPGSTFNGVFNPYLNTGTYTEVLSDNGANNQLNGYGWWQDVGSFSNDWIRLTDSTTILSGAYVSGGTITGTAGQTCVVTPTPSGSPVATATVALTGTNTIASGTALTITNPGSQYLTASTVANLSSGTAACSGTAAITTVIGKSNVFTFNPHTRTLSVGTAGVGNVVANQFLLSNGGALVSKDPSGNVSIGGTFTFGKNLFGTPGSGSILRLYAPDLTQQNRVDIQVADGAAGTGGAQIIGTYQSGGSGDVNIYNETTATLAARFSGGKAGFGLSGTNVPTSPLCVGNGCPFAVDTSGVATLPTGSHAVTQASSDNSTDIATDAFVKGTVTKTTWTLGTTAVPANTCTLQTAITVTGLTTSSAISWNPQTDVSATAGFSPSAGSLYFVAWPTANTINWKVCNASSSSITPGASTTWNVSIVF
jgi:hypothetical protein